MTVVATAKRRRREARMINGRKVDRTIARWARIQSSKKGKKA